MVILLPSLLWLQVGHLQASPGVGFAGAESSCRASEATGGILVARHRVYPLEMP